MERAGAAGIGSGTGSGQVQVNEIDFAQATWWKSSWSTYNGNCVEVAELRGHQIGVRDTKNPAPDHTLVFSRADWSSFLAHIKNEPGHPS
jgi:Domain of unknown function (DUF397)